MPAHAAEPRLERVAVLGGAGAVGQLFAGALADAGCTVLTVDRAPAAQRDAGPPGDPPAAGERGEHAQIDVERPSAALEQALAGCDAVVLALPEAAALGALAHVLGALAPGALLVDTLSVKGPFVGALRAAAAPVEALSLNPMFAPSVGFAGRPVLAVEVAPGPRSRALVALLRSWGARVVAVTEEEHDAATAALQAATHAALLGLGLGLARTGADLDALLALAPPPFVALLALLARIASASPETYWDVQAANPRAADARAALAAGLAQLDAAVAAGEPAAFEALIGELRALLGGHREPLAGVAATLVAHARVDGAP
jgi:4-amino-4-deoxyprephenate dehydrogenase